MVLNNAFLIHHGFKVKESFHSAKDEENARNRDIFRTLKKELKIKYPRSTRHCWIKNFLKRLVPDEMIVDSLIYLSILFFTEEVCPKGYKTCQEKQNSLINM